MPPQPQPMSRIALTGLEGELGGDVRLLVELRSVEVAIGIVLGEIGAAILPVAIEEEVVEPVRQVVMMGDVALAPGATS